MTMIYAAACISLVLSLAALIVSSRRTSYRSLSLNPGDHVVVKVRGKLKPEEAARFMEFFKATFPGHKVFLVDDDVSIEVIRG